MMQLAQQTRHSRACQPSDFPTRWCAWCCRSNDAYTKFGRSGWMIPLFCVFLNQKHRSKNGRKKRNSALYLHSGKISKNEHVWLASVHITPPSLHCLEVTLLEFRIIFVLLPRSFIALGEVYTPTTRNSF